MNGRASALNIRRFADILKFRAVIQRISNPATLFGQQDAECCKVCKQPGPLEKLGYYANNPDVFPGC